MSPVRAVEQRRQIQREELRDRILSGFADRAVQDGPRAVVMAELARALGISTRTLYQHFPSKAELVGCLMRRWAEDVARELRENRSQPVSPYERMLRAAESWLDGQCRFSRTFWEQLGRDFPDAAREFQRSMRSILQEGRQALVPYIRDDIDAGLALSLMNASLAAAADPERCERLGLSRQEAVRQAIEVWARGVLRPARALHVVPETG